MLADLRRAVRYARELPGFLRDTFSYEDCWRLIREQLEEREERFLRLVEGAIFGNPASPYRALLGHLGIEQGDVVALVRDCGVDAAVEALYESGARISLEEFKCRTPIVRPGLELRPQVTDFENPMTGAKYAVRTRGSGGSVRRTVVDFESLELNTAYVRIILESLRAWDRDVAVWYPGPPGVAGIKLVMPLQKLGKPVERWFSQTRTPLRQLKPTYLTEVTIVGAKRWGPGAPRPEYTPAPRAEAPARWLAEKKRSGSPAVLGCTPSSAVRVCQAACEAGLDISGSVFRMGGEPYTPAKARVLEEAGCRGACSYYSNEISAGGICCGNPTEVDEVHLIQRRGSAGPAPDRDGEWHGRRPYVTNLRPTATKIALNVESGDYATVVQRECGCPVEELGLGPHLHTIRSYDKLATEGMNFLGSELHALLEEVLPERFGGYPTDYQFVEEEENGLTRVSVVVSPRLGPLDDGDVREAILGHLGAPDASKEMMSEIFRLGETLRVLRREPHVTEASKTLPFQPLSS